MPASPFALRSPTALRVRRRLVRGADAILSSLRLVEARREGPSVAWAEPVVAPTPRPAPEPPPQAAPETDTAGPPIHAAGLDRASVQAILDEMVRPALQSDGGDITLVDVRGGEVHVELVGACHSCPSAVLTMKMGVEQLLAEELEGFERLVQVNAPGAM